MEEPIVIELRPDQAQRLAELLQGVEAPGSIHPARWKAMQTCAMPEGMIFASDLGAVCDLLGWVKVMQILRPDEQVAVLAAVLPELPEPSPEEAARWKGLVLGGPGGIKIPKVLQ